MRATTWVAHAFVVLIVGTGCSTASPDGPDAASANPTARASRVPGTPSTPDPTAASTATVAAPTPETPAPTAGSSEPPTTVPRQVMNLRVENSSSARLGEQVIGSGHTVDNVFTGELVQQEDGSWKGPATATSEGSNAVFFLTERCEWSWEGEQMLDLTAEEGTFANGNNFRMKFVPTSNPTFAQPPLCDFVPEELNGVRFLPYFDDHITDGGWVELKIAAPPGGQAVYEDDLNQFASFNWTTNVAYLEPAR